MGTLKDWTPAGSPLPSAVRNKSFAPASSAAPPVEREHFLTKERQSVKLVEKIQLSHDTFIFRFGLPKKDMVLGLPIGKHIKLWCPNPAPVKAGEWNGRPDPEAGKSEIERKYTPCSLDSDDGVGHFDVAIKVYKPNDKFSDGGKMSQHLDRMKIGDSIDVAGPFGLIEYKGNGNFLISKKPVSATFLGLMAGGTGITPILQLLKAILKNPNDPTKLSLIFANQTEEDILLRSWLEELQAKNPTRFKLHYTLDRPPANWKYSSGFISEQMIRENLPPVGNLILMCGPPPMVKFACKANLEKIGFTSEMMHEF